jgi:AraC family transcriptional regulator, regulatory protein of adaptative response / methylated-DNA-[protein]-cysteine methyltransferase
MARPAAAGENRAMDMLDDAAWSALLARDGSAAFLYGVTTMGIYCRPGCPARPPLRRNTRFFADSASAEAAGFRPCKRCDPKGERAAIQREAVRAACAMIEAAETVPPLEALAARAGYARHHFLRLFRAVTGVTPKAYADAVRARRLADALAGGERVAEAVAGAGYGSESRVYGAPARVLGMTPGAARRGGLGEVIRLAEAQSAMGPLLLGATEAGVCYIGFGEPHAALRADAAKRFPRAVFEEAPEALAATLRAVVQKLAEPARALDLPLDLRGTAFQRRVWEALRAIPLGQTRSYAEVAQAIDAPRAVRAVARAIGANPAAPAVPCHRVIGSDGALTGYRWGVERKRKLLAGEGVG